jgi:hypothetical protein
MPKASRHRLFGDLHSNEWLVAKVSWKRYETLGESRKVG